MNRMAADRHRVRQTQLNRDLKEQRASLDDQSENNASAFSAAMSVSPPATAAQIEAFEADLVVYDTAVVEALMENQRMIDAVQAEMDALLARAHVMEDGRRVFKTADGTQVFDEFGADVTGEIDPMMIADDRPTWETYAPLYEASEALKAEREAILEYQQQLDDAREAVANGDITQAELEDLQTSLTEEMPDAVRVQLPTDHPTAALEQSTEVAAPSSTISTPDISDLQGFAMPAPGS